ncbi:histone deacetylase complex subunit SAP18 isoform X3 [Columba livia]|uniref:histone deacetylase complex subunit SAP18 isoform X3 n=1 Tax=Columba livia TaxID=8932 RepID=UPI0031BA6CA6
MAVESRVTQEEIKKEPEKPIDREKTCPLLLRVFTTNNGRHHRMDEFSRGNVPSSELQIYTWMDATLKELTSLVKEVYPEARKKGTHFNFAIVFTDLKRPGYRATPTETGVNFFLWGQRGDGNRNTGFQITTW